MNRQFYSAKKLRCGNYGREGIWRYRKPKNSRNKFHTNHLGNESLIYSGTDVSEIYLTYPYILTNHEFLGRSP